MLIVYSFALAVLVCIVVHSLPVKREEIVQPVASEYLILPNDRILIVGGTNALIGASMPHGFARLLNNEANNILSNVTTFGGGSRNEDHDLQSLKQKLPAQLKYYRPSKVFIMLGLHEINSLDKDISQIRYELESILVYLGDQSVEVILCPIDIYAEGEAVPEEDNALNDKIDQLVWITSRVAKDYGVMQIDLHTAMMKYLELTNFDNLPQGVLTYDGFLFNERGHAFVAQTLMERLLGLTTLEGSMMSKINPSVKQQQSQQTLQVTSFMINNAAAVEQRRVAALKNQIRHNAEFKRKLLLDFEMSGSQ